MEIRFMPIENSMTSRPDQPSGRPLGHVVRKWQIERLLPRQKIRGL